MDPKKTIGLIVLTPPDMEPNEPAFDPEKSFALWDISREDYMREHYPDQERYASVKIPEPPLLPGRSVDVDGRRVNIVETGKGGVTVVLESDVGDDHHVWSQVQELASGNVRVVSYDRAGLGLSAPSDAPRSPRQIASELHSTLEAAGVAPPYVLVGHAAGTFQVRTFAALYPEEVAAVILVDPAHEQVGRLYETLDLKSWSGYLEKKSAFFSAVSKAAASEFDAFTEVLKQGAFEGSSADLNVPVIVLSSARAAEQPRWVGETPDGIEAKMHLHKKLAAKGTHIVTEESSSYIHLDKPELIVDAIDQVLRAVRK